jgi:hypothetical protein
MNITARCPNLFGTLGPDVEKIETNVLLLRSVFGYTRNSSQADLGDGASDGRFTAVLSPPHLRV